MKLFKKKHKKSAWFKSLLRTEQLIKDGYKFDGVNDWIWFRKPNCSIGIKNQWESRTGAQDCLEHYMYTIPGTIDWNIADMENAVAGGSIRIPSGSSREERREWIMNNNGRTTE